MNFAQLIDALVASYNEAGVSLNEVSILIRVEDPETGVSHLLDPREWAIGAQRDSGETNWVFTLTVELPKT